MHIQELRQAKGIFSFVHSPSCYTAHKTFSIITMMMITISVVAVISGKNLHDEISACCSDDSLSGVSLLIVEGKSLELKYCYRQWIVTFD